MRWLIGFAGLAGIAGATTLAAADGAIAPAAPAAAVSAPVPLAEAFTSGAVELSVYVVPGYGDGRRLRLAVKNRTKGRLPVAIPAGALALDVGDPIGTLYLFIAAKRTLAPAPGRFSEPFEVEQTGTLRAIDGTFWLYVDDGKPQFRGEVTTARMTP